MRRAVPAGAGAPVGALDEHPLDALRAACAELAGRARLVCIRRERLAAYAAAIPADEIRELEATSLPKLRDPAALCAFVLELDAINFGSGWFPELAKRPGLSGYRTLEACLRERFEAAGALSSAELRRSDAASVARLLGQSLSRPSIAELMELYARAWRDLGAWLDARFGGDFMGPVRAAGGSVEALVRMLCEMPLYRDVARYDELEIPFLKRAQLTVADLARAVPAGLGELGRFGDLERLTIFADNLVPHVLRLDGVLDYDAGLVARIEAGELLPSGAQAEVEIRACALHAAEELLGLLRSRGVQTCAALLDDWLWRRGAAPAYKAHPRHRTRCPWY